MGKSMLIEKFARANAVVRDAATGTHARPVLVVSAPPNPTEAGSWIACSRRSALLLRVMASWDPACGAS
jgi:hypothetical protein